jgi:hypothetical protein
MAGQDSLPWQQTQGEKGGQLRRRGSRPQRKPKKLPENIYFGGHKGWSAEPRNEPEPVWVKREKLEERVRDRQ